MANVATAQTFVVDAIAERGAAVFKPTAKSSGINFLARTSDRKYIELRVASPEVRSFQAGNFKSYSAFYIMRIVQQAGAVPEAWVLPTLVGERYSERSSIGKS
jgi:hypothetical protein